MFKLWVKVTLLLYLLLYMTACNRQEEPFYIIPRLNSPTPNIAQHQFKYGPLSISKNQIYSADTVPVSLKGVVLIDPYFLFEFEDFDKLALQVLVDEWNVNIVRIPVHPDLYQHNLGYLEKYVDPIVAWAKELEIYILLGYHAHGNIRTGASELPVWKDTPPWRGNPFNANRELAHKYSKEAAERYKDDFHVLYSIFNEPVFIDWSTWKQEAEALIDVIRNVQPEAIVMVSGVNWGYDLSEALIRPIPCEGVIYETHPYPWSGNNWTVWTAELALRYPVFLGEWGYDHELGSFATPENYALPLLTHCDHNNMGWTAWIYHDDWTPTLINTNGTPNELGRIIKNHLNELK